MAQGGRRLRGALGWLPALVLVPVGFAVAAQVAEPPDPPGVTHELFPLDPGTTWVYAVSDHGEPSGTHTRHVLGEAALTGVSATIVRGTRTTDSWTDYPGQGARRSDGYFAARGDRIDQYALISGSHQLQELDPPAKVYELLDEVGDSWTYRGTLDFQDLTFTTELAERGPVTVSGHTFDGCSRFVTTIPVDVEGQPTSQETQEEWTCPGYGPVRSSDVYGPTDVEITEELVEFHGRQGNWYADGPPAAAAGGRAASTLGLDPARSNALVDAELGRDLAWTVGRTEPSNFPPVSSGEVMVTGYPSGLLSATDVSTGAPRWQVQLEPPILVTPAIAGSDVVVADGSKEVRALALADGSTRWVHELDDVASATPGVADDAVAVATEDGRLNVLELDDGAVRWDARMGGPATAAPAVHEGRVLVCDKSGAITAYDLDDGDTEWSRSLASGVLRGPAVADGRVLVQDDNAIIYELDEDDGRLGWQSRTRGAGSGLLAADDQVVATVVSSTDLTVVDAATGRLRWRHDVPKTQVAPVLVGDELLSVSARGRVQVFDLATGDESASWELPRPVPDQVPRVDVPIGVVGESVVVSSGPGTSPAPATLYAYPLHGTGQGVLLQLDPRDTTAPPTGPVAEAGDDLYVPGYDGSVTRTPRDGPSNELVHNDERIATTPAVADGLAVVRKDDQLQAVPVDGGKPVWSVPAGKAYSGSTPLVLDGTVYAGSSDGRLLALSLADGAERWSAPVSPDYLPSTPVALPDGDVVYGLGLARYDAASGRSVWSHADVVSYGAPATAGGAVFAAVDRQGDTSGFGAWDAGTGAPLWFVPGSPAAYVGPSVADGVVLFSDAFGTVHALDTTDGTQRWATALDRPVGGTPVIRDGRVFLAGLGRPEDANQRDYRVVALDLRTGRFLASWEPPLTAFWVVPFVSAGEDDALLVPTGISLRYVVVGVRPSG